MCKQISKDLLYQCDGNCGPSGTVWGSFTYTGDSNIYLAAKHAGLIPGRFVKITKGPQTSFIGSTRNGVTTSNYGNFNTSYVLVRQGDQQHQSLAAIQSFRLAVNAEIDRFKQTMAATITDNKMVCVMCMGLPRQFLCSPCNHVSYCQECIKAVVAKGNCAVCGGEVTGYMKVFL